MALNKRNRIIEYASNNVPHAMLDRDSRLTDLRVTRKTLLNEDYELIACPMRNGTIAGKHYAETAAVGYLEPWK